MKKSILFLSLVWVLFSCNKKEQDKNIESNVKGVWKLKEVLADPGDGSGVFNTVNSNKTVVFGDNGIVTSNGSICNLSIASTNGSTGIYSEANSTITSVGCPNEVMQYKVIDNALIITYLCIEACKEKYIRVP